jgi:magnesium-transporting ATPase (P-type)
MQIVNLFLCRSPRLSVFTPGPFSNRLIPVGILVEIAIVLLIVYTDPGNSLFGTAPVAFEVWLFAAPFAAAMLAVEEGRKWLVRQMAARRRGSVR